MTKEQAYHAFWSGFGWKAYDSSTVPDDAALPRITYDAADDDFDNGLSLTVSLWDRSTSWASVTNEKNKIADAVTRGGVMIPCDGGSIWIKRGTPWATRVPDEDDGIRRILLNVDVEFII